MSKIGDAGKEDIHGELRKALVEIKRIEKLVYLAGHWQCPKCQFYLVSTSIHVPSGGFSANTEPQQCANGCGPMWRVTHEQSANTMVDRLGKATAEVSRRDKVIEAVRAELKTAHRPHADSGFMISDYLIRQAIKKFDSGG